MSRQSEKGCLIWLTIGGFLLLINVLKENPQILIYAFIGIIFLVFIILLLDFLHTLYIINIDNSLKNILKYDIKSTEIEISNLKSKNKPDYFDLDKAYQDFIDDINNIKKQ